VGESTSREFRLALAQEAVREQDIIAVDADLRDADGAAPPRRARIWAKVQRIERINPLFPTEAGHELAATRTNPFDTVLSLSREMVSAVCQVLGSEPLDEDSGGRLDHVRYPPQPATTAYRPDAADIARVVLGDLNQHAGRALDIATLSNRPDVSVEVDGHDIVSRHLAILAMTGAGKSWSARRIIEQLAEKNYPILIFDPHGDYTGLAEIAALRGRVRLYYSDLPVLDEDEDTAARIVSGLSGEEMTPPQQEVFSLLYSAARTVLADEHLSDHRLRDTLVAVTGNQNIERFPLRRDLFALSYLAEAAAVVARQGTMTPGRTQLTLLGFDGLDRIDGRLTNTCAVLGRQLRRAAFALREMQDINRRRAGRAVPIPADRNELIQYGQISVVTLAGYSEAFQATLYTLIARHLFRGRVRGRLPYRFMLVLEEAHTFVPRQGDNPAIARSIAVTKQIAQEGRKFGVGLTLISQRPSRLDETTLSQCNSYIIMRMVNPDDQSFVRRVIESLGEDDARMLPDLDVGEAILSGQMVNFPVLVRMKAPASSGEREEGDSFRELVNEHRRAQAARRGPAAGPGV
jgi:DNA helicase HerA-like ATPase